MVKVSMEVSSGTARFDVAVQAESIEQAVSLMEERYSKARVLLKFPIESESFFVEDPPAQTGVVGLGLPARVAA